MPCKSIDAYLLAIYESVKKCVISFVSRTIKEVSGKRYGAKILLLYWTGENTFRIKF